MQHKKECTQCTTQEGVYSVCNIRKRTERARNMQVLNGSDSKHIQVHINDNQLSCVGVGAGHIGGLNVKISGRTRKEVGGCRNATLDGCAE